MHKLLPNIRLGHIFENELRYFVLEERPIVSSLLVS
jgi:hypothetical protein